MNGNNLNKNLRILTYNTFYDGVNIDGNFTFTKWIFAHTPLLKTAPFFKLMRTGTEKNWQLIRSANADIVILQEILPNLSDETIKFLKKNYQQVVVGRTERPSARYKMTSLIASNLVGEAIDFRFPGFKGYKTAGLLVKSHKLLILAIHTTAFPAFVRNKQISYLANYLKDFVEQYSDYSLLMAGDFNCEAKGMKKITSISKINSYSKPSYPKEIILQGLNQPPWQILKKFMMIKQQPRGLDQIVLSSDFEVENLQTIAGPSDHKALFAKVTKKD